MSDWTKETEEEEEEKSIEKTADKLASLVRTKLNLDDKKDIKNKIFSEVDLEKADGLRGNNRIVGFFKALLTRDDIAIKALSEGIAADGGYLVPDEFKAELIKDLGDPTRMRSLVRVVQMHRDIMNVPKLGSRPQVRWTSENAAKSTTTIDFSQKTLTAYKCSAILYASEELVEDSVIPDLVKTIVSIFAERIAEEEDKVITAGSGTGQPTGLTNCTITNVACSGNLGFDDIINLIYALPTKYRKNAKFLVNNVNIRELRKLKDTQNRYIWVDNVVPGQPSTIHGYPVIENSWLPESEIYFGDYKQGYWLGDRRTFSVTISNTAGEAWTKDQVGIRISHRIGGNCVLENAIRCLNAIP